MSVAEVHALLCASDASAATSNAPAPVRRLETTQRLVEAGLVHVLRLKGEAVAMFTLTWEAPSSSPESIYPPAEKPAYIQRLAVKPGMPEMGVLLGARCLRRAVELAESAGADVLRSEANPDLERVRALLKLFGFESFGQEESPDGRRRVFLQKNLSEPRDREVKAY